MSVKDRIESQLKDAIRAGDEVRKTALRAVIAAMKLASVEKRADLDDAEALAVIQREIKSQRETIADARKADRPDLAERGEAMIAVLASFLPRQLDRDEIAAAARAAIAEAGASGPGDMGRVMKILQPRLKGMAEGRLVSDVVKELLSRQPS